MKHKDQDEIKTEPIEAPSHWRAKGALEAIVDDPSKAVRLESNPNPMYATVDDELTFWCFDYSKKCQVRQNVEDAYGPFETVVDQIHAYASDGYPISVVSRDEIDDDPKPVATSLDDFEQGVEQ